MNEPSDPSNGAPGEPGDPGASNEDAPRRTGRFGRGRGAAKQTDPAVRNGAVFTDSRVEIEIDDETGRPQLRIVAGARPKT